MIQVPKNFSPQKIRKLKWSTPYFIYDPLVIKIRYQTFVEEMPKDTEICYAMKANSESQALLTIYECGGSFEVASKYELAILKKLGIPPKKIVYGTAVKPPDHIESFVKYGVDRFAFDSEHELQKISKLAPGAKVYARSLVDDRSNSVFRMSEKFGANYNKVADLMMKAKELGLKPYGLSFNVGSQAKNANAWHRGITDISRIMVQLTRYGIKIDRLNIGGGFPIDYEGKQKIPAIQLIGRSIQSSLKSLPYHVKFIAEPGRFLVAESFVLVCSVIEKTRRQNGEWLYIDAGVYNALFEAMAFQGTTRYKILSINNNNTTTKQYILTGPTGDNIDVINKSALLPENIQVGDKIIIYDVGAYTFPLMTRFNGFPKPPIKQISFT